MLSHLIRMIWNKRRANGMILLEILLAFVVLFGVGTFALYNYDRYQAPLGFTYEHQLGVAVDIDDDIDSLKAIELQERARRELLDLPGVESVAWLGFVNPFGGSTWGTGGDENGFNLHTYIVGADENFAETMQLEMRDGRWFDGTEDNEKYQPIVVNGELIDKFYSDRETMVDSIININGDVKIIGVVDHFKYHSNFAEPYPHIFYPQSSGFMGIYEQLIVRTEPGRKAELQEPIYNVLTRLTKNTDVVIWDMARDRIKANRPIVIPLVLMAIISGFLLINVALGLFGVLFTQINNRRAEIGLRKAMGATPGNITGQLMLEMGLIAAAGLLVGILFAVQVPILELVDIPDRFFYWSILMAIFIILFIVVVCTLVPSRQAAGLHPAHVLHEE